MNTTQELLFPETEAKRAAVSNSSSTDLLDRLSLDEKTAFGIHWVKAVEMVKKRRRATSSLIQSHCRVGYNMARAILQKMEDEGFISEEYSDRPRDILI